MLRWSVLKVALSPYRPSEARLIDGLRIESETPLRRIVRDSCRRNVRPAAPYIRYDDDAHTAGVEPATVRATVDLLGAGEGIRTLDPNLGKVVRRELRL
jgi:hypothetical protein